MTRIIHVSFSDSHGGAARAARRLNHALGAQGADSRMAVINRASDDATVTAPLGLSGRMRALFIRKAGGLALRTRRAATPAVQSLNWCPTGLGRWLDRSDAEVVNLHWLGSGTLGVGEIARIGKPLVWTMHDMWPFCGTEHYCDDGDGARFVQGFSAANRPGDLAGLDVDRWLWRQKQRAWRRPFDVVTPSHWLAGCVRRSKLMADWPVRVIPNPIDLDLFAPFLDQPAIRRKLRLPEDRQLIAFGAIGGGRDPRKGFDLFLPALRQLAAADPDRYACVVIGQSRPRHPPDVGLPMYWMGALHDEISMAFLYNAVDVMVVPSRQDNLPQTGTEAQACGCPVVAFDCAGMPDVVEHRATGYLARAFDVEDLAAGMRWVLDDSGRHGELAANARRRAMALWSPEVVAGQYMALYARIVEGHG